MIYKSAPIALVGITRRLHWSIFATCAQKTIEKEIQIHYAYYKFMQTRQGGAPTGASGTALSLPARATRREAA
jgi:hypothetical protein